ncbi:MAG: hypothetical protein KF708_14865 [Pirellulales bacterium]|nr:hypothetical protein [Pirellulales bacterium]
MARQSTPLATARQWIARFWRDEQGAIVASELLLIATLLVIGLIAALAAIRSAVVTELGDFAASVGTMNQSFSVGGTSSADGSFTAASAFADAADSGDSVGPDGQQAGGTSACIIVCSTVVNPG